jgi:ATP-dependent HslUV protease ATP-binding subunit HslU
VDDFKRILREPHNALTKQYVALLGTEGVGIAFTDSGIDRLAEVAYQVNERTENIGARRLHTVMERLLERISFEAADKSGEKYLIDAEHVDNSLGSLVKDEDLSRYIL